MNILVINAGSTSLKFGLFEPGARHAIASGSIDWADGDRSRALLLLAVNGQEPLRSRVAVPEDRLAATAAIRELMRTEVGASIGVVGHRVVHGGTKFFDSALIDPHVKETIAQLADLAPLHNPPALAAIEAAESTLPGVPQVAVFDTAFFARLPQRAHLYPVPYDWYEQWGVRRFGFHGISNAYCAVRAAELVRCDSSALRLVTCHLGGGCSATAVRGGVPVATTMGFSALEGLPMGSRSGSIDPGILIHLQRQHGLSADDLDQALCRRSGLLGISGVSQDLSKIEQAAATGHVRAQLAFDIFADRVRSAIGSLAVTMGGLDALLFTDRIGEGSPALRAAVCDGLECLGVQLDGERNASCQPDADIASDASRVRVLAVRTREELMIARETRRVVNR